MGKPFDIELDELPSTYAWAMAQQIEALTRSVQRLQAFPLLAVGSGGSFSVCHFICHLHGLFTGQPALPMSPLQAVADRTRATGMGIVVPTASGNNPDVIAAVRLITEEEPKTMLVLCGNAESRVADLAARYELIDFAQYDLPAGKDGFLATNSLLAFCVLMARAYADVSGQPSGLPKDFRALLGNQRSMTKSGSRDHHLQAVLQRETLVVLHSPATLSAAVDLESKFTEAALGQVQICDYRQFAHGRHHWLAKRPEQSAILSVESLDDEPIATQTLDLLPKAIPVHRLQVRRTGWLADLAALCEGFYIAGAAGRLLGIDPGRPGVPSFGRKLYHANAFAKLRSPRPLPAWQCRAIERKATDPVERLQSEDRLRFWQSALESLLADLASTSFAGLVVDYDGTLCNEDERFGPLPQDSVKALSELLASGIRLGVATGRGKSVRECLRNAFLKTYWPQILVGYYNGGELLVLSDSATPNGSECVGPELVEVAASIREDALLSQGPITLRERQITLGRVRGLSLQALCNHAEAVANRVSPQGVRVMRSGHSVDIVPHAVSKLAVVARLAELAGDQRAPILRIGDRGQWPGNDAQLLASAHGLSVHEVSPDPKVCWNLAWPGHRGRQATIRHLLQLKVTKRGIRLKLPDGGGTDS